VTFTAFVLDQPYYVNDLIDNDAKKAAEGDTTITTLRRELADTIG
jgi:hypothetical protein